MKRTAAVVSASQQISQRTKSEQDNIELSVEENLSFLHQFYAYIISYT